MNKDEALGAATQTGDGILTRLVRRNSCLLTLLPGLIVGLLIGILNFVALNNRWKIQGDYFDIVDAPIRSLIAPFYSVRWTIYQAGWTSYSPSPGSLALHMALVLTAYWTVIGLFLAWLFCLVRIGVIGDIARDKICRYTLFFASCGGMFIGSLSFLAASNGWENLDNCFDSLNQPIYRVTDAITYHFDIEATTMQKGFICWHAAAVIYWGIIGLLLAFIFCVIRILKKRNVARGNPL